MSDGVLPVIVIFWAVAFGYVSLQRRGKETDPLIDELEDDACSESRLVEQLASTKQKWQYDVEMERYLRQLPKVELHVHLDGSFDPLLLQEHLKTTQDFSCLPVEATSPWDKSTVLVREMVKESTHDDKRFHSLCTCRGKGSLHEMIKCFEVFVPIVRGNLELLEQLSHDFVRRQSQQNIVYTEVRYSPHLLAEGGDFSGTQQVDADPVVDAVTRGLRRGETDFGVKVNQIMCCIAWRPDWADDVIRIAQERRNDAPCAIVGVDIAAGEEHFDKENFPHLYEPHYKAFQRAQELGLNITMHAGEAGGEENIKMAVQEYGATRIGHGYRIVRDSKLMEEMRGVHFEICPTSSVETGGWVYKMRNWNEHPAIQMIRSGMKVGFNSDDPAVFDTSLTWQLRVALGKMGLSKKCLLQAAHNSIDAAFLNPEEKDVLRRRLIDFTNTSIDRNVAQKYYDERVGSFAQHEMEES
eukprot:CAMPEP_0198286772 /NCGR_PEP_ID=MMETSP1449-20131203/5754_1 /TAXON_ID=420275 /ORGANISM="Attheya septentrionalis, Strain CCMP2084" /LENGTH=467 /DNA_ID=CAMNT_0043984569 /DNA_START=166 /DNA_END=1569 /DNA_ORIENTATION=-